MAVYVKMIKSLMMRNEQYINLDLMKSRWEKLSLTKKKIFNILNQVNDSRISNQAYENWASEQILKIMFRNDGQFPDVTSVEK